MPRLNIEHAQVRDARYDPAINTHTADLFESVEDAYALRKERVDLIRGVTDKLDDQALVYSMRRLARRLTHPEVECTLADPVYMRSVRRQMASSLGHFLNLPENRETVRFVTIVPRDAQYRADAPIPLSPNRLQRSLRTSLNRCGAGEANGLFIAWLEGDYDPRTGIGQLHWHGFVAEGMIQVVQRLMDTDKYRSERAPSARARYQTKFGARVVDPIKISTQLDRLPRAILYCLKQRWWARPIGASGETGEWSSFAARGKHMPPLVEAHSLLWRDKWSLSDITLMMGMYMGADGLALSK
ncbi:hypothetical protein [Sphingomonas sp. 1P08PE]|uniref:hypothetical protein n=1 Tax=Sphingomonas sp. 1P08PE TaxID=554122 RepID=UPI0039A2BA8E